MNFSMNMVSLLKPLLASSRLMWKPEMASASSVFNSTQQQPLSALRDRKSRKSRKSTADRNGLFLFYKGTMWRQ